MLKNEQKSAKTLPQKLAGLNKGRGAWGENLARGVAWQNVVNSAKHNTAQRGEFGNETAQRGKIQRHDNKIQHNEFIKASTANDTHSTTNSTKYGEFGNANSAKHYFAGKTMCGGTAKMGQCLGGGLLSLSLSLSLSLLALVAHLWAKFKGLFTHFIVVSSRLIVNFSYFIAVFPRLFVLS